MAAATATAAALGRRPTDDRSTEVKNKLVHRGRSVGHQSRVTFAPTYSMPVSTLRRRERPNGRTPERVAMRKAANETTSEQMVEMSGEGGEPGPGAGSREVGDLKGAVTHLCQYDKQTCLSRITLASRSRSFLSPDDSCSFQAHLSRLSRPPLTAFLVVAALLAPGINNLDVRSRSTRM